MDDFKVKITTTADTAGAKAAAEALHGVSKSAGATGKSAADAGKNILTLGETTEKGIGIGRMFSEVLQGNFYALGNVTAALKVTGAALKTSIVGVALLALTALANFLPTLIQKLKGDKDSLAGGFDAAREAGEKLNKAKLESLQANLEAIKTRANEARAALEEAQAAADQLDDAEMGAQLAENKVATGLSDDQRAANDRAIRGRFAEARRERKLAGMAEAEAITKAEVDAAAEKTTTAAGTYGPARDRVAAAKARRAELAEANRALEIEQRQLTPSETEASRRARGLSGGRAEEIRIALARGRAEQVSLDDPAVIAQEKRESEAAEMRRKEFEEAQKGLLGGLGRYDALRRKNYIARAGMELLGGTGGPESRKAYAETYGAAMDTRSEPDPVFRAETRVIDSRSLRAASPVDTRAIVAGGEDTGRKLAAEMTAAVAARDAALVREFQQQLKALRR